MEESPPESPILEQDVRAIVHLLGEVIASSGDIDAKRRMLLDGLCGLIGGAVWVWSEARFPLNKPPEFTPLAHGGSNDGSKVLMRPLQDLLAGLESSCPSAAGFRTCRLPGTSDSKSADREQALGSMLSEPGRTGRILTSTRLVEGGMASGIALARMEGDRPFDERESRMARIILTGVHWLHLKAFPDPLGRRMSSLYPRHRVVLDLLSKGWSRKCIAGHLGVSVNTVHGYVKAVFKHFNVHSQAELISRLTHGLDESEEA